MDPNFIYGPENYEGGSLEDRIRAALDEARSDLGTYEEQCQLTAAQKALHDGFNGDVETSIMLGALLITLPAICEQIRGQIEALEARL